jgi:uncharacterized protein (TIGR01777 family)
MRFLIAGATGLIGSALHTRLNQLGHEVTLLVRPGSQVHPAVRTAKWEPLGGDFDSAAVEGHDVVVCLSGHNLMDGRWTPQLKQLIIDSRVKPVGLLAHAIARAQQPPKLFLSGSAVGIYGHTPYEEPKDESSAPGTGFLAEVCKQWEAAAEPALSQGATRTVLMRTGFVLSMQGGALIDTVGAFKRGIGGVLGSGKQVVSWITLPDLLDALIFTVDTAELRGPVNYCAPGAVTNKDFTHAMGHVLHKPAFLPIPAIAARAKFGEVADELLLNGQRAVPRKLNDAWYRFRHPEFEAALKFVISEGQ